MPEKKKEIKITPQQLLDTYRSDQRKLDMLQRREQNLQQILSEMLVASEAIKEIQKSKKDESVMVSLGAGVYAEAKITNTKSVKKNIGGSVLIEAEADKMLARLKEDINRAQKDIASLQTEKQRTTQNIQGITEIMQQSQRLAQKTRQRSENTEVSSVS